MDTDTESSAASDHGRIDRDVDMMDDDQTAASFTNSMFAPKVKPVSDSRHPASSPAPTPSQSSEQKMKPSGLKKKGTAATTKKGPARRLVSAAAAKAARANRGEGADDDAEARNDSDADSDNGPYCICRGPDDHRWMISCEACEDWFHGSCVDLDKDIGERLVERFVCPNCTDGKTNYTKFKKTCALPGCNDPARQYKGTAEEERSVFCSQEHCDSWWISVISKLPKKAGDAKSIEALTQDDFMGLLVSSIEGGGEWKLGQDPFENKKGLWQNGLPTEPGVLSEVEQNFLQQSAAERLALGNEIVQYKKMMQVVDWAKERRQAAIEAGKFTKDSCGYDCRLDTIAVRHQFAAWLESPEGQTTFKTGKLGSPATEQGLPNGVSGGGSSLTRGMCEKKRCKPHQDWYKMHLNAVRQLIKEATTAAGEKLEAEEIMRQETETKFGRRNVEHNWVEVLE